MRIVNQGDIWGIYIKIWLYKKGDKDYFKKNKAILVVYIDMKMFFYHNKDIVVVIMVVIYKDNYVVIIHDGIKIVEIIKDWMNF